MVYELLGIFSLAGLFLPIYWKKSVSKDVVDKTYIYKKIFLYAVLFRIERSKIICDNTTIINIWIVWRFGKRQHISRSERSTNNASILEKYKELKPSLYLPSA